MRDSVNASIEIYIPSIDKDIEISGVCEWEDQGIGSYEYWGHKGNNVNYELVLDVDSIEIEDSENLKPIEHNAILNWINENLKDLTEQLEQAAL